MSQSIRAIPTRQGSSGLGLCGNGKSGQVGLSDRQVPHLRVWHGRDDVMGVKTIIKWDELQYSIREKGPEIIKV